MNPSRGPIVEGCHVNRIEEPTPRGGAYAILYEMNDVGEEIPYEEGRVIVEYDARDNSIARTYLLTHAERPAEQQRAAQRDSGE